MQTTTSRNTAPTEVGYVILVLVVVSLVALGRRIPPVMAGIALLATASLFPALSNRYYLVFVMAVAALVVRDPDGPAGTGLFDRLATVGGGRRTSGTCVSLAAALSIAQIALPGFPVRMPISGPTGEDWGFATPVPTTVLAASLLWLVTCAAIIISCTATGALTSKCPWAGSRGCCGYCGQYLMFIPSSCRNSTHNDRDSLNIGKSKSTG